MLEDLNPHCIVFDCRTIEYAMMYKYLGFQLLFTQLSNTEICSFYLNLHNSYFLFFSNGKKKRTYFYITIYEYLDVRLGTQPTSRHTRCIDRRLHSVQIKWRRTYVRRIGERRSDAAECRRCSSVQLRETMRPTYRSGPTCRWGKYSRSTRSSSRLFRRWVRAWTCRGPSSGCVRTRSRLLSQLTWSHRRLPEAPLFGTSQGRPQRGQIRLSLLNNRITRIPVSPLSRRRLRIRWLDFLHVPPVRQWFFTRNILL